MLVHSFGELQGLDGSDQPSVTSSLLVFFETSHSANSMHLVPMVTGIKEVPSEGVVGLCVM